MAGEVRLPLGVPTTPRNADSLDKDALLQNGYVDQSSSGTLYAVKRPGFYVGSEAITTGLNRGVYINPNNPTGGTPGQTQVWYIGSNTGVGGGLSSFSTDGEPPVVGFRDFSFNANYPSSTGDGSTRASESSTSPDVVVTVHCGDSADPLRQTALRIGTSGNPIVYGQSTIVIPAAVELVLYEVKLESNNFNLYKDGILLTNVSATGVPGFINPALSQAAVSGPFPTITNLQFI
jgi:hypothetical protein